VYEDLEINLIHTEKTIKALYLPNQSMIETTKLEQFVSDCQTFLRYILLLNIKTRFSGSVISLSNTHDAQLGTGYMTQVINVAILSKFTSE